MKVEKWFRAELNKGIHTLFIKSCGGAEQRVVVISATDWEAEQKRVAALEQDAARHSELMPLFERLYQCVAAERKSNGLIGDVLDRIDAAIEKGGANG